MASAAGIDGLSCALTNDLTNMLLKFAIKKDSLAIDGKDTASSSISTSIDLTFWIKSTGSTAVVDDYVA